MFLPINVKIEVGEIVSGYSLPYASEKLGIKLDHVRGVVERIDEKKGLVKVDNYADMIYLYRIETFTFGGIEIDNDKFDAERMWKENQNYSGK